MEHNPFRFNGPLDLVRDRAVCIPRDKEVRKMITSIANGDYCAVLGPRQIGKTTFLNQIKHRFPNADFIYIDAKMRHLDAEDFYQWLRKEFLNVIPSAADADGIDEPDYENPEMNFYLFLKRFKPKSPYRKIIILLDEIESLPFRRDFLFMWRKVYNERYYKKELNKYGVVITGSSDLIGLTIGPNSPFNIAKSFYIKDFSIEESRRFIYESFKNMGFQIENEALDKIVEDIPGHPQMLQHCAYILAENKAGANEPISPEDVKQAFDVLLRENGSIKTLKNQFRIDTDLQELVKMVLEGENIKYYIHSERCISQAGPLIDKNNFCAVRNNIYKKVLVDLMDNPLSANKNDDSYTAPFQALVRKIREDEILLGELEKKMSSDRGRPMTDNDLALVKSLVRNTSGHRLEYRRLMDVDRDDNTAVVIDISKRLDLIGNRLAEIKRKHGDCPDD